MRDERGQATVELVGLLPLGVGVAMLLFCALAAGRAEELAGHAAQAGAVALLQEQDAARAVRSALPAEGREDVDVQVKSRRVTVTVRPDLPLPALAERFAATDTADAGPVPRP